MCITSMLVARDLVCCVEKIFNLQMFHLVRNEQQQPGTSAKFPQAIYAFMRVRCELLEV